MDYTEAQKKIQAEVPKANYMSFVFGYDCNLILPHKDGMELLKALGAAEMLEKEYGKATRIAPINRNNATISLMSAKEYQQIKIAALLNIDPSELDSMNTSPP